MDKRIFIIVLLILILAVNINLYYLVKDKVEDLDGDPLQRGARYYNAEQCYCNLKDGAEIFFNESSTWQIIKSRIQNYEILNTSLFKQS